jgi:hypothetical protein
MDVGLDMPKYVFLELVNFNSVGGEMQNMLLVSFLLSGGPFQICFYNDEREGERMFLNVSRFSESILPIAQ